MKLPRKLSTLSLLLKGTVIVCALLGTWLSAASGRGSFMGGSRVFMFFTIQSNILMVAVCLAGAVRLLRGRPVFVWQRAVEFTAAVSITLTGVVFAFVLAPTLGTHAWNVQNILTHVAVPSAAVLDFFVTAPAVHLPRRSVFLAVIPPLMYAVYAGIGYARGWEFVRGARYPYFFLNWGSPAGAFGFTKGLPFMGTGWWILAISVFLLGIGRLYLAIAEKIERTIQSSMDPIQEAT